MRKHVIRSIGVISKKEDLVPVERLSDCKFMILESAAPFPGYHGTTLPEKEEPDALYLVLKRAYNDDKIIRVVMNLRKTFPYAFDGAPGSITMGTGTAHVIRLKKLSYTQVPELAEELRAHGIEFRKRKKLPQFNALIKVRKFFAMKEAVEGIYQDLNEKRFSYLKIPCSLRWNTFERITMEIKYNIRDNVFDAAIGHVYEEEGLFDFVRIFDKNFRLGKLAFIREKYLEQMARL